MKRHAKTLGMIASCCAALALWPAAAPAASAPEPAWSLAITPMPSNFDPAAATEPEYLLLATNVGAEYTTTDPVVLEAVLPVGLKPTEVEGRSSEHGANDPVCEIDTLNSQRVLCKTTEPLGPGRNLLAQVSVDPSAAAPGTYVTPATVSGGGAGSISAQSPTKVQSNPLEFGFLPGFKAPITEANGEPTRLAGSHPYQQTISFAFPTVDPGDGLTNDGHPRDFAVELPRGMVGDPAASPVLCTEAELTGKDGCPDPSQVGLADVTTIVGKGNTGISTTPIYNMVPPPGTVAELATDVADAGIYAHILASVRSGRDYGVQALTPDALALGTQPIFSIQAQIWGDPSSPAHDHIRGACVSGAGSCPVDPAQAAFLTMPADCPGHPLGFEVRADTWERPNPALSDYRANYESADLAGDPVQIEGCGDQEEAPFKPTIGALPTTNLTDSPAGLGFTLHQPQDMALGSRSPAPLRDAAITFPAGLAVNPSQAAGLGACSEAQAGFEGQGQGGELLFSAGPQSCPDAAKLGTVEATSPLLVARNEKHEVEKDIEGKPVPEPLHGSIYLAQPFANPFDSLVAVYLVIEDKQTGIIAKLAGKAELNPQSGQITTSFRENPEVPIEDIHVTLFGGDRGAFITPPACGTYTTASDLTPWSAPAGKDAFPQASFATTRSPRGGNCPTTEAQLPSTFKLNAGSQNPAAGKYSPLLFKLSREDGTQRLSKIESTLPRGVIAKLAGVGTCSEAAIAKARSREAPQLGASEQADPSCPAASQIGTVIASAGAGSHPYYTSGHAYLAGPYKGAPISIVAIVPAVAGPFDLGTVLSRIAVYIDPVSAEVRAVSDPLPTILHGVPVDLRSVALRADRPNFSLNPTSCEEKSFGGQAITTLGQVAPLFERFQVGGCASLPYKPKMSVRLFGPTHRGAHPRLKAVFTAKPGEANTAAVSFTFPRSEFIDQAHFRTICTRVQFAAKQCPAGSIYGHVKVLSPLVDYPLEGPAYLRSSSHKLPDLVVALHGPPSQPIEIDADGRVDSVNGGLRVRFEEIPDAPVSKLIFSAQGAKKGLFQNSTDICKGTHRATLKLNAQNGKVHDTQPKLVAQCSKESKHKRGGGR
jgi:hypothetical protein